MSSIERFNPLMIEAWRKAILTPVKLPVNTKADATSLRHQLYRCRKAMIAARHELANDSQRISIVIREINSKTYVVMEPAINNFDETFAQAGISLPEPPSLEDL